ncbi:Rdx family protein, partial [Rhodococcus sp. R1101]|uniref:Rdx family protein n=1 Tax=Rhodococcus sp. R1101 TaxID=1170698 RepID=UPI002FC3195A
MTGPCRSPGRSTTTIAGASPISGGDILSLLTERTPRSAIACARCRWLLRAGRMAQELPDTFGTALGAVVRNRKEANGFPENATLGQWVRELV